MLRVASILFLHLADCQVVFGMSRNGPIKLQSSNTFLYMACGHPLAETRTLHVDVHCQLHDAMLCVNFACSDY